MSQGGIDGEDGERAGRHLGDGCQLPTVLPVGQLGSGLSQPLSQVIGQGPDGPPGIVGGPFVPGTDRGRLPDPDEGPRAKALLVVVDQGHDHGVHVLGPMVGPSQSDAGRPGAEGLQRGPVVTDPFGEDGQQSVVGQHVVGGGEGRGVAVGGPAVLGAVHRYHAGQMEEGPEERIAEEGGLPEEAGVALERGEKQQPIDQTVAVVGHQHGRPAREQPVAVLDLDVAEEGADQQTSQPHHQPRAGAGRRPSGPGHRPRDRGRPEGRCRCCDVAHTCLRGRAPRRRRAG